MIVYLASPGRPWPELDITDETGQPLGFVRRRSWRLARTNGPMVISDRAGNDLLLIQRLYGLLRYRYVVSGTATGQYRSWVIAATSMTVQDQGELAGSIGGDRGWGSSRAPMAIYDHDAAEVGGISSFRANSLLDRRSDHVLSIDPSVQGSYRRLLLAAPVVLALVDRLSKNSK